MLYIGIMSGTSSDGADAVLADLTTPNQPKVLAHSFIAMPAQLRQQILDLNKKGNNELERSALAARELSFIYAQAVSKLLKKTSLPAKQIKAIGVHGQTVRHRPDQGFTIQINAPALLAELCSIDVIADFRSRDIAAGGQGAPLVPAFHAALFGRYGNTVVLNLGGIANITILHNTITPIGFDTGPANTLMDAWIGKCLGLSYDNNGSWASTGKVNSELLKFLLESEPWFETNPPKSTGLDLFNLDWLEHRLHVWDKSNPTLENQDIQATLSALTAQTVCNAINKHAPNTKKLIVCGGGSMNEHLMSQIESRLDSNCKLTTSASYGVDTQHVEALAFAWLAYAWDTKQAANLPEVTGANGPRILGCKYPA